MEIKKEVNEMANGIKADYIEEFKKFMNPPVEEVDNVNHPKHYEGKFECIDEMERIFGRNEVITFCQCNAFKYLWRWNKKNGIEDVRKAQWYINKAFDLCELDPDRVYDKYSYTDELCIETQGAEAVFRYYIKEAFTKLIDSEGDSEYLNDIHFALKRALVIYDDFLV